MQTAHSIIEEAFNQLPSVAEEIARQQYCDDAEIMQAYLSGEPLPRYSRNYTERRRQMRRALKQDQSQITDIVFNPQRSQWQAFVQGEFIAAGPTPRSVQAAYDRALTHALRVAFDQLCDH